MDYVNIFLTLPNPLNTVFESNVTSPSPSSDSLNSDNSMENSANTFLDAEYDDSSESELTNLAWLTEIKNIGNIPLTEKSPNRNPTVRFNKFMDEIKRSKEAFEKKSILFRTNPNEKPPFNYAHIIGMAMMDKEMMTLKDICNWIKDNFAYYKYVGNWNNSIRHNLSLSVFFTKVARDKNEKGKGGYWKLAMDYTKTEKKRVRRTKNSSSSTTNNNNSSRITNHNLVKSTMPKDRSTSVNQMQSKIKPRPQKNIDDVDDDDDVGDGQIENDTAILIASTNDDNTNVEIVNGCEFQVIVGGLGGIGGCGEDCNVDGASGDDEAVGGCIVDGICDMNVDGTIIGDGGVSTCDGTICIVSGNPAGNGEFVYNMDVCLNDGTDGIHTDNYYETVAATEVISELNHLDHEIFLESDIPQPIDEIALPFVFNLPQNGPNVITEAIPQFTNLPGLDSIDNSDFSSIKFNEYDELDKFLNCSQDYM